MEKNHTSKDIEGFIIRNIEEHAGDISRITQDKFGISRQAVNRFLRKLTEAGQIEPEGKTRQRKYTILPAEKTLFQLPVNRELKEDEVWRNRIRPLLNNLQENILRICEHGFTEIMNNVIDHSESKTVKVEMEVYPGKIVMIILDKGVGIFKKIADKLRVEDKRLVALELSKGKLTTDEAKHSGEGIFFTSRMFDEFSISSGDLSLYVQGGNRWTLETKVKSEGNSGTEVTMKIRTDSKRTISEVFNSFAAPGNDYSFTKTQFPVRLAKLGDENLISRSQAKRLLTHLEPFKEVVLDFTGVDIVGQSFADEIFRVFQNAHPEVKINHVGANIDITNMIRRVKANSP
jgi:anti-sigma regulatory factor (Ser/Thr protein kinase)